ncbi:MAG: hypothetical protein K8F91_00390, partial [Candidatus Obscuribacterales bacterium]|nr:hypothetical protein [Candidatus Obscuribacterales bacterium]
IALTIGKIHRDFESVKAACDDFTNSLLTDDTLMQAYFRKDRKAVESALQKAMNERHFPGFISIIEADGKVFFNTETPKQHGYSAAAKSEAISFVLNSKQPYYGATEFTATDSLALSAIAPIKEASGKMKGLIVVSQPLNSMYLTGETTRFGLETPESVQNVDLLLFKESTGKIVAASEGAAHGRGGALINEITEKGAKAFPGSMLGLGIRQIEALIVPVDSTRLENSFESSGRWWYQIKIPGLAGKNNEPHIYGRLLLTTPVPDVQKSLIIVLIGSTIFGALALFLGLIFSAKIKGSVEEPLHFLIDRTNDIADKKSRIPPLEGLSGDWLELGELID